MRIYNIIPFLLYSFIVSSQALSHDTKVIPLISSGRTKAIGNDTMYILIPDTTLSYALRHHTRYEGVLTDGINFVVTPDDLKDGKYIFYYDSLETEPKYRFSIKNHNYSGLWREFYPEGNICETSNYTDGKENGLFILYNCDGTVDQIQQYSNGKPRGFGIAIFENSTLAEFGYYKNDSTEEVIESCHQIHLDDNIVDVKNDIKIVKKNK